MKYNEAMINARDRIESLFDIFSIKFRSLSQPWREGIDDLDSFVHFVSGLLN